MTENYILGRLQPHTVDIYGLAFHDGCPRKVKARTLLTLDRFDLFAKLYYIEQREAGQVDNAKWVYEKHIMAFNPDCKEPGRDDKNSIDDFVGVFNELIEHFRHNEFDDSISLIPVSENGSILDGAHRVAALAYFDKEVTIAQFYGVPPKCRFDYAYFINRGLSWTVADIIANNMVKWTPNIHVACLWPKMGSENIKQKAVRYLDDRYTIIYEKRLKVNLSSFISFISRVYDSQPWVTNPNSVQYKALECFDNNREVHFVFFQACELGQVLKDKEVIRDLCHNGKHTIHITDNDIETRSIAGLILTSDGLSKWYKPSTRIALVSRVRERLFYFKKVSLINFKVSICSVLKKLC